MYTLWVSCLQERTSVMNKTGGFTYTLLQRALMLMFKIVWYEFVITLPSTFHLDFWGWCPRQVASSTLLSPSHSAIHSIMFSEDVQWISSHCGLENVDRFHRSCLFDISVRAEPRPQSCERSRTQTCCPCSCQSSCRCWGCYSRWSYPKGWITVCQTWGLELECHSYRDNVFCLNHN